MFLMYLCLRILRLHSLWRSSGAAVHRKILRLKGFQRLFFYVKKILSLQHQTITYEPTLYIFHFTIVPPSCGVLHLFRKRKGLGNRPVLLRLKILQQRLEYLAERGPDEWEISFNLTLRLLQEQSSHLIWSKRHVWRLGDGQVWGHLLGWKC